MKVNVELDTTEIKKELKESLEFLYTEKPSPEEKAKANYRLTRTIAIIDLLPIHIKLKFHNFRELFIRWISGDEMTGDEIAQLKRLEGEL